MVYSPPRRASCLSRLRCLVCKILILLLCLSETNTIGWIALDVMRIIEALDRIEGGHKRQRGERTHSGRRAEALHDRIGLGHRRGLLLHGGQLCVDTLHRPHKGLDLGLESRWELKFCHTV